MLSKTIAQLRGRAGLTQREFARLVGVSLATVKAWEGGRFHSLSTESQHKVREALGLTPEEVLDLFFRRIPPRHEPREPLEAHPKPPLKPRTRGERT